MIRHSLPISLKLFVRSHRFVSVTKALVAISPFKEFNVTKIFMIAAATALVSSAAVAEGVAASPISERVTFADLDLLSSAGNLQLEARIRQAARDLCVENTVKPLSAQRLERACFDNAVADGIEQAGQIVKARRARQEIASSSPNLRGK